MRDIPRISPGDRVRIMQTDEMVRRKIANVRGTVDAIDGANARILTEFFHFLTVPLHSIIRDTR